MKLLFISNLYSPLSIGGYEELCFEIAHGLEARGHQVHVLTSSFRAKEICGHEGTVSRTLKVSPNWKLSEYRPSPWIGRNRLAVELHNARTVRRVIARVNPHCVVIWNGEYLGRALPSVAEDLARVAYYLCNNWLAWPLAQQAPGRTIPFKRRLYRAAGRVLGAPVTALAGAHLIFCSNALKQEYCEAGAAVGHGIVIHHGVNLERFPLRRQRMVARDGGGRRILLLSRITPDKGVSTLVAALSKVRAVSGLEATKLTLCGPVQDQSYERYLRLLITKLELSAAVEWQGHRPKSETPALYEQHDVLAFPSEWREPFSLMLPEAMATGIPVVSTTCGGSAELIRDGENALAFRAGDAEDLAHKLIWLLQHRREAGAMGLRASAHVRQHFTRESQISAVESFLLDRVVGNS